MKRLRKIIFLVNLLAALLLPLAGQAFSIVPCGGPNQSPCQFDDLIVTAIRLINYLLSASAVVAAWYIVVSGWQMMASTGNAEKLEGAKEGLTRAVVGFAMILLAFAFVNLALGIFGITCQWWVNPKCLYTG
ncbi:MAG: hypothetical protein HY397_00185 [Candidatus Doudnabacteria bacterium]|nr:hypothetical protein [Candidatus Doudnabacteria bacterium]